jgi:hypothetical protein
MSFFQKQTFNKKLGYYTCDGIEFHSKIEACFYGTKVAKPVKWVFNNGIFSSFDWTVEPDETLDQLYDQRARQLREKYDYIILSYSGGADSNNIYESFRRQNLHIDEIVVNTMTQGSERFVTVDANNKDPYNAPESEHQLHLIPRLKQIEIDMPRTKINIFDMSKTLLENMSKVEDESWIFTMKEGLNPIGITRFNYLDFDSVKHRFDKGKSIALITGIEKLRTVIRGDRLICRFNDRSANINTVAEHIKEYDNCTVEYFYWAPESTRMLIKQGHVIKRYLETFPEQQKFWVDDNVTPHVTRTIHERILRTVLYSTWNNNWYQADKSVSDWYSEFDRWFIDNYQDTRAWQNWNAGIEFVKSNLTPFLRLNPQGQIDGLKIVAHQYDLGPIKLTGSTWLE